GAEASKRGLAHLANRRELYIFPPKDYRPGLWPPSNPPAFLLLDLTNQDTLRELDAASGTIRGSGAYRELERTPNALLLAAGSRPESFVKFESGLCYNR